MKKRIVLLLVAMLTVSAVCAGCAGGDKTEPEKAVEEKEELEGETAEEIGDPEDSSDPEETADTEEAQSSDETEAVPEGGYADLVFDTTDLDGNPVHSTDLFAQHRITMVNVWMTWCGPCVAEMPELAQLSGEFAEQDIGLIGVCMDAVDEDTVAEAHDILTLAGAEFPVLAGFEGGEALFQLYAVPTSFFVDREGHVLGSPVIGADPEMYRKTAAQLLEEMDGQ